ncbi:MAG: ComEC/Rec2 family competence protein [Isosphaeraceae bacterium]|nr:ComEC/Rec2 family competence protein [Isosphaeraceae bacterium]
MKYLIRAAIVLALSLAATTLSAQFFQRSRTGKPAVFEFLDVGQGDSILIRSPEGKTALIDAGTSTHVVQTLKRLGISSLDLVVVSHHHSDHYGGMHAVIEQFHPKYFLASNRSHTTSLYLKLLKEVRDQGIQTIYPTERARKIELGSLVLTVFPQPPEDKKEENNNSIGIRVDDGAVSLLLTGDSEETERQWWIQTCPNLIRNAQILKLAHHGSRNGTDAHWLDLVKPEVAVASVGTGNDYGHPHRETLSLLASYRIPLKRTDESGTVTIESDGRRWQLLPSQVADRPEPEEHRKRTRRPSRAAEDEPVESRRR